MHLFGSGPRSFSAHKKMKELTEINKTNQLSVIKDKRGKIILDIKDDRQVEVKELFYDCRPQIMIDNIEETGPKISV